MPLDRNQIAKRASLELKDGFYVNLGIGMPTLVANYMSRLGVDVVLQSENGMLGMGPFPYEDEVDPTSSTPASRRSPASCRPQGVFSAAPTASAMIRGGHIDLAILGAMEVSERGDLANWMIPGKLVKGMGGAMDLVAGARRVIVCDGAQQQEGREQDHPRLHPAPHRPAVHRHDHQRVLRPGDGSGEAPIRPDRGRPGHLGRRGEGEDRGRDPGRTEREDDRHLTARVTASSGEFRITA
jgi:3-oxoacid CoA-transferase B subunit